MNPERIPSEGPPAVLDAAFRSFWDRRRAINKAINALLFSGRLARHEIEVLRPHLRQRYVRDIYPADVAATRFNYRLADAADALLAADDFLADAAFVLGQPAYEEYLDAVVTLVGAARPARVTAAARRSIPARHIWLQEQGINVIDSPQLCLFDFLREARNVLIHKGSYDDRAVAAREAVPAEASAAWERAAESPLPTIRAGDRFASGSLAPVAMVFAVGNLAVEVNRSLVDAFTPDRWADLIVVDFRKTRAVIWRARPTASDRLRPVVRHGLFNFGAALGPVASDETALLSAIERAPRRLALPDARASV